MNNNQLRIGDISQQVRGVSYKPEDLHSRLNSNSVILLRANNISDGKINFDDILFVDKKCVSAEQYLRKSDVLICASSGSKSLVGKAAQIDFDIECTFGAFCKVVRPYSGYEKYLAIYFQSMAYRRLISELSIGVNINNIRNEHISSILIPDASKVQMDTISTIYTALRSIIDKRRRQLALLDKMVKARFVEMFGDPDLSPQSAEWVCISEIGKVIGGSTPKTAMPEYWDGEYRWITPAELEDDTGVIYDSRRKITKAGVDSCSLQELPIGTVLLTSRAPIGKLALAGETFYCNQGFKNIVCNDRILPRYLYTLLFYNTDYLNSLGRGATFKEISKSIVESIRIPLPSLELQSEFLTFSEQVDKTKAAVQKSLDKVQVLFDSLMQKFFG